MYIIYICLYIVIFFCCYHGNALQAGIGFAVMVFLTVLASLRPVMCGALGRTPSLHYLSIHPTLRHTSLLHCGVHPTLRSTFFLHCDAIFFCCYLEKVLLAAIRDLKLNIRIPARNAFPG